ncbi:MAG: methyltransferase type 11 [Chloroflexi bacterium]|nr:MAG: methyltransferase type 11 [Chloroflexota bacterium]
MPDFLRRAYDIQQPELASALDEVSFWSSRFGAFLFKHLPLRPHLRILDLGCGTGFPSLELAQVYGTSCMVTGIDIWKEAILRAQAKQLAYQISNVELQVADAARLPSADQAYDLIVCHLGINNFDDPEAVLAECFRVTKPGATLVLTTNPTGHMREFYALFREVLLDLEMPAYLERLDRNEAHRGTRVSLVGMLQGAGFGVTRVEEDTFDLRYLDGTALFHHVLTQVGFLDGWRQVVETEHQERVFTLLETRLNQAAGTAGGLRMSVPMLYLEAAKPD